MISAPARNRPGRALLRDLRRRLGYGATLTSAADLFVHSFDATPFTACPDVVVGPSSVEDLVWACEKLWEAGVPVTPRGAGTGFSGGALAAAGGAVVVCDRLKAAGPLRGDEVTVEPGVVADDLNRYLAPSGFFYPVDPASSEASTLGGHVAENAGGPRALKYGVTRDYVLALDVLSPGRGRELYRDAPGRSDAVSVLVGSEGTLAVTLGATLKVLPRPEATAAALASFKGAAAAAEAANAVLDAGVLPAKMEFLDARCVECINRHAAVEIDASAAAVLMLAFDGAPVAVADELAAAAAVIPKAGGYALLTAETAADVARLWAARTSVSPSLGALAPFKISEDVCVPRSRLPALLAFIAGLERRYGFAIPTFGHVGDGNLHVNFMFDRREKASFAKAEEAAAALMKEVIALKGTITGEHGVGLAKARFLPWEQGPGERALAARVKAAYDPRGLLNPGKIWSEEERV